MVASVRSSTSSYDFETSLPLNECTRRTLIAWHAVLTVVITSLKELYKLYATLRYLKTIT